MDATKHLRHALGAFATGVTVVTTKGPEGEDVGRTANSFSSVSLSPPMVLWSLAKSSSSLAAFRDADHFAVHVLSAEQADLSALFAGKAPDKFAGLQVDRGDAAIPLLRDCTARFECRTVHRYDGGDHIIFVAEVTRHDHEPVSPLIFHGGAYGRLVRHAETLPTDARDDSLVPDDPIYLISRLFYRIRGAAAQERRRIGLDGPAYAVLTALGHMGALPEAELIPAASARGDAVDAATLADLAARGWIANGARIALTDKGRQVMIPLIAALKAAEVEALSPLDMNEIRVLKQLLARTAQDDGTGWPPVPTHTREDA